MIPHYIKIGIGSIVRLPKIIWAAIVDAYDWERIPYYIKLGIDYIIKLPMIIWTAGIDAYSWVVDLLNIWDLRDTNLIEDIKTMWFQLTTFVLKAIHLLGTLIRYIQEMFSKLLSGFGGGGGWR